jgi:hypothetical protein
MAELQVRYRNGEIERWTLHEAMDLRNLIKVLTLRTSRGVVSLGVVSDDEGASAADYDFVGLSMAEVVSWRVTGLFDAATDAALWAELEGLSDGNGPADSQP